MDFTNINSEILGQAASVLAFALIIVGGYTGLWAVGKVINLIKYDCLSDPNDPANYDHDVFDSNPDYSPPPSGEFTDYDPNGNYFRRDGMWRKFDDFK